MRATLDFHGFSGGFTTVRQFLSRCWSSSEMLQGVEKEGLHMRIFLVPGWVMSPSCGGVEPLGFKGSDVL
ncbi:BnaA03g48530D [Brassica napus]|uniref:BnaA03g48530D protein n=1 Tax=Brassica napus TaxID=3708 RepID=A0A078DMR6_BRANA|nr:BnaC04g42430D [Brassica napus]CDY46655.1 BnaA03g48530D [Brassica napus]